MDVSYGGLKFKVVRTLLIDRQPVLDDAGVDYLFTKFTLNLIAIVNNQNATDGVFQPEAGVVGGNTIGMAYGRDPAFAGPPEGVRPATPAFHGVITTPVITDTVIRHWLKVPRRQLIVKNTDGQELIRSPKDNRPCDAHNGPFVDVFSVQEVMGDAKTFVVNFQITTYINECEEAENVFAPLLANRFSQHHELDQDYFLTVVTQGTAQFRTDFIHKVPAFNPDSLRPFLFLPIPYGFKRENIQIQMRPDVSGLDYSFVDRQQAQQFVAGNMVGATRIEANYRQALASGSNPLGNILQSIERAYNFRWAKKAGDDEPKVKPEPTPFEPAKTKANKNPGTKRPLRRGKKMGS